MDDLNGTDPHWPCDDDEEGINDLGYDTTPEYFGSDFGEDDGEAVWVAADGSETPVKDMTDSHLLNAIRVMGGWNRSQRQEWLYTALCDERDARFGANA